MPPSTTHTDPEVPQIDPLDLLKTQRDGDLLYDFALQLTRLVAAVRDTGKPGHVTLTLNCSPGAVGNGEKVAFKDKVDTKLPRHEYAPNLYYTTDKGGITRHNPRQLTMAGIIGEAARPAVTAATYPSEEK
jgi:hypothetical protein